MAFACFFPLSLSLLFIFRLKFGIFFVKNQNLLSFDKKISLFLGLYDLPKIENAETFYLISIELVAAMILFMVTSIFKAHVFETKHF